MYVGLDGVVREEEGANRAGHGVRVGKLDAEGCVGGGDMVVEDIWGWRK